MADESNNSNKPPIAPTLMGPTPSVPVQSLDELTGSFPRPKLDPVSVENDNPTRATPTPQPPVKVDRNGPLAPMNENQTQTLSTDMSGKPPAATNPLEIPRPKISMRALTQHFKVPPILTSQLKLPKFDTLKFVHPKDLVVKHRKATFGGGSFILLMMTALLIYWRTSSDVRELNMRAGNATRLRTRGDRPFSPRSPSSPKQAGRIGLAITKPNSKPTPPIKVASPRREIASKPIKAERTPARSKTAPKKPERTPSAAKGKAKPSKSKLKH